MTLPPGVGLKPLADDDLPDAARDIVRAWPYNLHRTLAHAPATLRNWMPFAEHILRENTLPEREREIAILRVGWNCRSAYEWGLHERLARSLGFTDADIDAICVGGGASHWSEGEAAIVDAVDDIQRDWTIADAAWRRLAAHYRPEQLVDLIFVTGQFMLVSVSLNALRVPLEAGVAGLPAERADHTRATGEHRGGS